MKKNVRKCPLWRVLLVWKTDGHAKSAASVVLKVGISAHGKPGLSMYGQQLLQELSETSTAIEHLDKILE